MCVRGKEYISVCLTILYLQCVSAGVMVRFAFCCYSCSLTHALYQKRVSAGLIYLWCASRDTCMLAQWECKIYDILHRKWCNEIVGVGI